MCVWVDMHRWVIVIKKMLLKNDRVEIIEMHREWKQLYIYRINLKNHEWSSNVSELWWSWEEVRLEMVMWDYDKMKWLKITDPIRIRKWSVHSLTPILTDCNVIYQTYIISHANFITQVYVNVRWIMSAQYAKWEPHQHQNTSSHILKRNSTARRTKYVKTLLIFTDNRVVLFITTHITILPVPLLLPSLSLPVRCIFF